MGLGRPLAQFDDLDTVPGINPSEGLKHCALILAVRFQVFVFVEYDVDRLSPGLSRAPRQGAGKTAPTEMVDDPRHVEFPARSREGGDAPQFGENGRRGGERTKGERGWWWSIRGRFVGRGEFHSFGFAILMGRFNPRIRLCAQKGIEATATAGGDGSGIGMAAAGRISGGTAIGSGMTSSIPKSRATAD